MLIIHPYIHTSACMHARDGMDIIVENEHSNPNSNAGRGS